jgi:JmjC domain, hydroxylase
LRHKRCLLSPAILKKAGIRYQTAVQYPGDAIITFPGGFHFGFNAGFNIAEATNFGVPEWIPFGRRAKICLCRPESVRIDMFRLTFMLQKYQKDTKRNRRLTCKEWRKRQERKEGCTSKCYQSGSIIRETANEIVEVVSFARKARKRRKKQTGKLSEQQRKNEFWIEVVQPVTSEGKLMNTGGKTKRGKGEDIWHLAKPIGRKGIELNTRILCLISQVNPQSILDDDSDSSSERVDQQRRGRRRNDNNNRDDCDDQEHCFAGTAVEVSDGYVRIHLDGLPRSDDLWVAQFSLKLFLDGGRWEEEHQATGIPELHYWEEMDSGKRIRSCR